MNWLRRHAWRGLLPPPVISAPVFIVLTMASQLLSAPRFFRR